MAPIPRPDRFKNPVADKDFTVTRTLDGHIEPPLIESYDGSPDDVYSFDPANRKKYGPSNDGPGGDFDY